MRLWLSLKAFSRLKQYRETVFYIQKVHYHAAAPFLLSRFGRNKHILDYDDWDLDRSPLFQFIPMNYLWFGALTAKTITRKIAREAVGCVAASRPLVQFLLEENDKVLYLPTGVNTERFKPLPKDGDNRVVFLWTGQVWGKVIFDNLSFVTECFKRTLKAGVDSKLLVVGRGKWLPGVRSKMTAEIPREHWEIREWVEPDHMPGVINESNVGLVPLIPDRRNRQWMMSKSPTKLFEYMACGIPSVATPNGDAATVMRHGEDGFHAATAEDFSKAMITLARDKQLRLNMGESARKQVHKNYSLNSLAVRLGDWLQEMLPEQGAPR
jgi:glycosyltransferase involved in cell wall biosynthesis